MGLFHIAEEGLIKSKIINFVRISWPKGIVFNSLLLLLPVFCRFFIAESSKSDNEGVLFTLQTILFVAMGIKF